MNWGKSIVLVFVLFAGFIATLVTVCVKQDINLVSKDYYKEELAYDEQYNRLANGNSLQSKPTISIKGNDLVVASNDFVNLTKGELILFRPSDSKLDRKFELPGNHATSHSFNLQNVAAGMYKVRIHWWMNDKEYLVEETVNL